MLQRAVSICKRTLGYGLAAWLTLATFSPLAYADSEFVKRPDVQTFIDHMVERHGFNKSNLEDLFAEVHIRPQVIRSAKKPLEKEPWHLYQMLFVSEWRIKHGVEFWNKHADALNKAEKAYGVPASIIVATLGVETKYGQRIGDFRVMDSLCSLGFTGSPRASYFRRELEEFLLLTREERLAPLKIMGSYAGAIGMPQFMPSSYRNYAVNFSRSGKTDLMNDEDDVIGSVANYYQEHGWEANAPVAVKASIIGDRFNYFLRNDKMDQPYTLNQLSRYGVLPKNKVGDEDARVKIIALQSHYNKEYWLGFHNFDVIKRYNASDLYAMAVYQLSVYISELREKMNNG